VQFRKDAEVFNAEGKVIASFLIIVFFFLRRAGLQIVIQWAPVWETAITVNSWRWLSIGVKTTGRGKQRSD